MIRTPMCRKLTSSKTARINAFVTRIGNTDEKALTENIRQGFLSPIYATGWGSSSSAMA